MRVQSLSDLRLVSERLAEEIKKQKASAALERTLKALTANLLRVVRYRKARAGHRSRRSLRCIICGVL